MITGGWGLSKRLEKVAVWVALAGACLAMYGRYLVGHLPVGADNSLMYAPFYALRWQGGPPLWNPYSLSGTALADNLQAALLYPLRWPFFFTSDWRSYFGLFNFLHYAVAFWGATLFLRAFGVRRGAALAGAIAYAAGGHLAGRIINPTIFYASCWLPFLLYGAAGRGMRHAWATTLGAAMILWIGSPHLMFYGMVGYGLVFLSTVIWPVWRGEGSRMALELVGSRALHLGLAFVLAAPALLPGIQRAQESIRTEATVAANLADSVEYREIPAMLLGGTGAAIHPEYIDKCCYAGSVALLLILWLASRGGAWRDRRFLCGVLLVVAGMFFALGRNIGIQFLMPWIPGFRNLAGASRALILTVAGLALLTGLALDALPPRPMRRLGAGALALGLAMLAVFAVNAVRIDVADSALESLAIWLRAWVVAPGALGLPLFPWIDAAVGLLAAGVVLALTGSREKLRLGLLGAIIFAQVWHFAPRVLPPTEPPSYFDPPPQVAYLQAVQKRPGEPPFRVAGYNPLQLHDGEFDNRHKIAFLMPNFATLYGLEDIEGFDPLIHLRYLDLFLKTSGRAAFNDPIHNLDIERPDRRLFDLLGVRFLVGHPYERRLTTLPQTLSLDVPNAPLPPVAAVGVWEEKNPRAPITHWLFVSLLDRALKAPLGEEVARLHVDAVEGMFSFPIRNGIETADLHALSFDKITSSALFRPVVNMEWTTHQPAPKFGYRIHEANYRGVIDFGRPLTVRRLAWQVTRPGVILNVAAQAYRLASPPVAEDPWRLVFTAKPNAPGHEAIAPVYEYREAKPRAVLVSAPAGMGSNTPANRSTDDSSDAIQIEEAALNAIPTQVKYCMAGAAE